MQNLIQHASTVRLGAFAAVLIAMALWELAAPRRKPRLAKATRWPNNLALVLLNTLVLRLLVPAGALGVAAWAQARGWGLLHAVSLPAWVSIAGSVVLLDLVVYLQHVMFHALPLLWRLHMVHHADLDFDVTTGLRFHTLEIVLSFGIKAGAILLLGAPVVAVLVFEVLLNATAMFNHGNVRLPRWLDRCLRLVLVTPDMHRVHHSVLRHETNSNFGFNLPWWDYLFGTYRAQPERGQQGMMVGLSQLQHEKVEQLPWMLALPFMQGPGDYPISGGPER